MGATFHATHRSGQAKSDEWKQLSDERKALLCDQYAGRLMGYRAASKPVSLGIRPA
jgi:hypothetical protein